MKKIFKPLLVTVLALAAVLACAFAAGCTDKDNNADADYVIVVQYKDGTKVNGLTGDKNGGKVFVQICLEGGSCVPLTATSIDENGKISLSEAEVKTLLKVDTVTSFVFHAFDVKDGVADASIVINEKGTHTLIVNP